MTTEKQELSVIDNSQKPITVGTISAGPTGQLDIYNPQTLKNVIGVAVQLAGSNMIPEHYRRNPENCFVALYRSCLMGTDVFSYMEQSYIYKGRTGFEAKFLVGRLNESKKLKGPLSYRTTGKIIRDKDNFITKASDYVCIAIGTLKENNQTYEQPYSIQTAIRAGYLNVKMEGGKAVAVKEVWQTITEEKMQYMAASNWIKMYAPEVTAGARTIEDVEYNEAEVVDENQEYAKQLFREGVEESDIAPADSIPRDPAMEIKTEAKVVMPEGTKEEVTNNTNTVEAVQVESIKELPPDPPVNFKDFREWFEKKWEKSPDLTRLENYFYSLKWLKSPETIPCLTDSRMKMIFDKYQNFCAAFENYKKSKQKAA